jgi:flagellar protein FliL
MDLGRSADSLGERKFMAKRPKDEEDLKPKKEPLPWGLIFKSLFVFLNVATLGGGFTLIYASTLGHQPKIITEETAKVDLKKKQEELDAHPVIYTMDPFSVNLDGVPRRFVRTVINLELLDDRGFEEVVTMGAQARDAVVRLLNGKTFSELETIQGKLFLKDQIASELNRQLKTGVIKDVYFTEFYVQ